MGGDTDVPGADSPAIQGRSAGGWIRPEQRGTNTRSGTAADVSSDASPSNGASKGEDERACGVRQDMFDEDCSGVGDQALKDIQAAQSDPYAINPPRDLGLRLFAWLGGWGSSLSPAPWPAPTAHPCGYR